MDLHWYGPIQQFTIQKGAVLDAGDKHVILSKATFSGSFIDAKLQYVL